MRTHVSSGENTLGKPPSGYLEDTQRLRKVLEELRILKILKVLFREFWLKTA